MNPKVISQSDIDMARAFLSYSPETGLFTWERKTNRSVVVGSVAGNLLPTGYVVIVVNGLSMLAHRLAWAFCHGPDIPPLIDHIDTNRANNRISNLRAANKSLNAVNSFVAGRGVTGLRGVSVDRRRGGFNAVITIDKKHKYIGRFETQQEAHMAYIAEKSKYLSEVSK